MSCTASSRPGQPWRDSHCSTTSLLRFDGLPSILPWLNCGAGSPTARRSCLGSHPPESSGPNEMADDRGGRLGSARGAPEHTGSVRIADRLFAPDETLHAPHLIDLEIAQVLRR